MVRFGAPFQYGQFGGLVTMQKMMWTVNFFGRVLLNKVTRGLTPFPVFLQISDANLKYSEALRKADLLTGVLNVLLVGILLKIGFFAKICKLLPLPTTLSSWLG